MGKLNRAHLIEAALWLGFAAFLFYHSFAFDKSIEIYRFGASGWPRAILALVVIAALGNLYWHYRNGDDYSSGETVSEEQAAFEAAEALEAAQAADQVEVPQDIEESHLTYGLRIVPIIALPFIYAYFLEGIGFYSLTPLFIALVIFVMGERRPLAIFGVTALIYALLLFLFAKLLFVGLPVGIIHPFYDFSQWLIPTIQNGYPLEFMGLAILLPLALFAIIRAKGESDFTLAARKAAMVYAGLAAFATLAAFLLGGKDKAFIWFDVLKWPLSAFT